MNFDEELEEQWGNLLEERPVKVIRKDPVLTSRLCRGLAVKLIQYANDEDKV